MNPIIQFNTNSKQDFYILIFVSIITILLVLTFSLGKDTDTISYETTCLNDTVIYSIPKICNRIYSNMYSYCQFGEIYSEILLWGLFSTYCIQTKELQMIFPIIITLMTIVCIIWNFTININLINNNNCFDIIYSYDYLSMIMLIINSIILLSIFMIFVICIMYYLYKKGLTKKKDKIDSIELLPTTN